MTDPHDPRPFNPLGAKAILHHDGRIVSILRDDIPTIPYPGFWDLPGGAIEDGETPLEAVLREIEEEIGLVLAPDLLTWSRDFIRPDGKKSYFFAGDLAHAHVEAIRLGEEGQEWRMMEVRRFVTHPKTMPRYRDRVAIWAAECLGFSPLSGE